MEAYTRYCCTNYISSDTICSLCNHVSAAPTHVVVMMDVSNPLTSDRVCLGSACYILSVLCAVCMLQCFGVPEPVRPLPGFDPRTFVKLNDFFRNLLLSLPGVHASRPARFMEMWLLLTHSLPAI